MAIIKIVVRLYFGPLPKVHLLQSRRYRIKASRATTQGQKASQSITHPDKEAPNMQIPFTNLSDSNPMRSRMGRSIYIPLSLVIACIQVISCVQGVGPILPPKFTYSIFKEDIKEHVTERRATTQGKMPASQPASQSHIQKKLHRA